MPPSKNTNGAYEWIMNPAATPTISLPDFVKAWIKNDKTESRSNKKFDEKILLGLTEGLRNEGGASVAGKLLAHLPKEEWEGVAWVLFKSWNQNNQPPLLESELRTVFDSIKSREIDKEPEGGREPSLSIKILSSLLERDYLFFHDQHKDAYVSLSGDGREVLKIRSRAFRQWLSRFSWEEFEKIPQSDVIAGVIQTLEGKALFDGQTYQLHVRVTSHENALWYDLANGQAVKIDSSGWQLLDNPPIVFKRFNHQLAQTIPLVGGNLSKLVDFINLASDDEKLLFLIYTVAAFIPNFPHPLLVFYGPQGAGKTTPLKMLKSLVDPSQIKTLTAPDSLREFVQLASHHYFFFLDNLSSLPDWLSDALARAVTGDGFSKRELFTDDDDIIYAFQRGIGLNGINLVIQKADLLDRAVLLGLERIAKESRKEETEIWSTFEQSKPEILGAIFSLVSKALQEYPKVTLTQRPRMADFAHWGCAIARALGKSESDFLRAYYQTINQQNSAAIEASLVGTTLTSLMNYHESWEGTASELLEELEKQAEVLKINYKKSRDWPKDPSHLSRKLQLIHSNLVEQGIKFTRDDKARPRRIIIQKVSESTDTGVGADGESSNSIKLPTPSPSPNTQEGTNADKPNGQSDTAATQMSLPTANSPVSGKDIFSLTPEEAKQQLSRLDWEIYVNHMWKKVKEEKLPAPGQ